MTRSSYRQSGRRSLWRVLALGIAAVALAPHAAQAAEEPAAPSVQVPTRDIDLTTPQGRRVLDRRIDRAARSLCQAYEPPSIVSSQWIGCRRNAIASAAPARDRVISRAMASRQAPVQNLSKLSVTVADPAASLARAARE